MTTLLCKLFVKDWQNTSKPSVRRAYGTMASTVGIVANLLLSLIKLLAGILSGSISITADAVNNLSDAGSQVISLVSFKVASKPADRDHPFGHARIEYVSSMIVSFLILTVGVELLRESVAQILSPTPISFSLPIFLILALSVVIKLWLSFFNRKLASKMDSEVMRATSADSLSDAIATGAVLISGLVAWKTGWQIDGYMGVVVAIIILIAGIRVLNDTKNSIVGRAPSRETIEGIANLSKEYPEILGIHDMVVHSYGPGNIIASFHAEVDGSANVFDTHDVIDLLEKRLWSDLGIRATVHMDPIVTDDERVSLLRAQVRETVQKVDPRLDIHDFRLVEGKTHSNLIFDVSAPFELRISDEELKQKISLQISLLSPNYFTVITVDRQ